MRAVGIRVALLTPVVPLVQQRDDWVGQVRRVATDSSSTQIKGAAPSSKATTSTGSGALTRRGRCSAFFRHMVVRRSDWRPKQVSIPALGGGRAGVRLV